MTVGATRSRAAEAASRGSVPGVISSFRLYLAAEGKLGKTVRMYTEAVQWFAAGHLLRETGRAGWGEVDVQDIQRLLGRYSDSCASNQYRALQQFFRWWSAEEELPDPMARLRPPKVREKLVPVFTSGELRDLERACQCRVFAQRRGYAIIAVFRAGRGKDRMADRAEPCQRACSATGQDCPAPERMRRGAPTPEPRRARQRRRMWPRQATTPS